MKKRVISPEALKALRERKGWSQEELAQRSKLTARRISSLEKEESGQIAVQQKTFRGLCKALGERPEVLSGEVPLPSQIRSSEFSVKKLHPLTRLNLDLLSKKYGFTDEDIINAAPLLLAKAAEATLSRQAQQLKEDIETGWGDPSNLYDPHNRGLGISERCIFEPIVNDEEIVEVPMRSEQEIAFDAICSTLGSEYNIYKAGEQEFWNRGNSFAYYLYYECVEHRIGYVSHYHSGGEDSGRLEYFPGERVPEYLICPDELERITCGSSKAKNALTGGRTSVSEIPVDLWEPQNSGKRVAWLEEKYDQEMENPMNSMDDEEPEEFLEA